MAAMKGGNRGFRPILSYESRVLILEQNKVNGKSGVGIKMESASEVACR